MKFAGKLFIVATPIGNLKDITERAIETLNFVDIIAAEDTNHSKKLLTHFGIQKKMISLHDHNEIDRIQTILDELKNGKNIALISDAGTPLISDPGFKVVREVRMNGLQVIPIPGACALIAALSASGLPSDRFVFEGFLPSKHQARVTYLREFINESRTLIFYESTHRILDTLKDMLDVFGAERHVVIAREMTKLYETILSDKLENIIEHMTNHSDQIRGEFVVLVEGAVSNNDDLESAEKINILKILLDELPLSQAVQLASKITGMRKNKLYELAINFKKGD